MYRRGPLKLVGLKQTGPAGWSALAGRAALTAMLAVGMAACADEEKATGLGEVIAGDGSTVTDASTGAGNPVPASPTGTGGVTAPTDLAPADTPPPLDLPGTRFVIGPARGQPMVVVGVRYDDELNLRTLPDPAAPVVATAAPLATTPLIRSAGEGRLLDRSAWWYVSVDDRSAWANMSFLGSVASPSDAFADLRDQLPAVEADDLDALVTAIAELEGGEEPRPVVTLASRPTATGVTFDLIGLGDDAVKGLRFAITVEPTALGSVRLTAALRTPICSRGVSGGLCL
jgi:hypothetical protein